ncbi:MAG: Hsp70 family protein [Gracilibacteraceae bacterium]|nr:Hsp70 family protein [Gracilibacteraceae bacterium]
MKIVGIDLGTTNSLITFCDNENGIKIIPNRLGKNLTPSCVSVSETGELFVGEIARERLVTHPELSVAGFKRYMGTGKKIALGSREFLPEELSSLVVRSLLEDAEIYFGEKVDEAVISVPAYFNDAQRKATKRAGELSGLNVGRIVNEPTAAAIAYGIEEKANHTKFLILDLGGGTYDVSLLERSDMVMEVRGVSGDNFFGGNDFTEELMNMAADKFGLDIKEMTLKDRAILFKSCDEAKKLCGPHPVIPVSAVLGGKLRETEIKSDDYERQCKELLTRLRKPIEKLLHDTKVKIDEIDSIILVGGGTRLSFIRTYISRLILKFPCFSINPDEVVAIGVGYQGAMKARNKNIKELILIDVCPYTLGTSVSVERGNGEYESGHYLPIIERNTVIPVSRMATVSTLTDNQREVRVKILQGESRLSQNNIFLGELTAAVPPAPAGQESVEIRYTYDINGILEVIVMVLSTKVTKKIIIEQNPGQMSPQEIEDRLTELAALKIHPRDEEMNKLLLARGERLYEENLGDERLYVAQCIETFERALHTQDRDAIKHAQVVFAQQMDAIDSNIFRG